MALAKMPEEENEFLGGYIYKIEKADNNRKLEGKRASENQLILSF